MTKYGLIGYPAKYSFSPAYFAQKFEDLGILDCEYHIYELQDINDIHPLVHSEQLAGFNVTIPHKQAIIPHLDYISEAAVKINAVNTVSVIGGKLHGDNTDYIGFRNSAQYALPPNTKKAMIFGTGGSSLAVKFALRQMGIQYASVSRGDHAEFTYESLTAGDIQNHSLLINTTPLGMHPNVESCVNIPYNHITTKHLCYDLVYRPDMTTFMAKCKAQGATVIGGLKMLEIQADKAWDIWNK